nr:hypothetical protein [Tanacetum cinerariifolium]
MFHTFESTARIETTNEGTKILATVDSKPRTISESLIRRNLKLNDDEGLVLYQTQSFLKTLHCWDIKFYRIKNSLFKRASQSPHHDPLSPLYPKATIETNSTTTPTEIPTVRQYFRRATRIAQSKALPTATDEPASLLRDDSQGEAFPTARIKLLEDKERGSVEPSGDDALIKGRSMEIGEEVGVERSIERGSNDTEERVNVLTSMDAAKILTSGVADVSVPPVAEVLTVGVPTVSGLVPTVSAIFTTASVNTCIRRAKDDDRWIDRRNEMIAKHLHEYEQAAADLTIGEKIELINELVKYQDHHVKILKWIDRRNEMIAKHLHEYEQAAADLTIGEKIELINELVKYQDHHVKILKYQAQQSKTLLKKEQIEFYLSVLRSHYRWKTKHFRGMTLEEIREKFIPVWKKIEDFMPMSSKEEAKRFKRKGLRLEQGIAKRMKTSEDVSEEDIKEMMQLVPVEEFDKEDLNQLWTLVKENLSTRQALSDKEKELWVELKRLFEPDFEDQLWTYIQALVHDPLEWKLYDICGVHHVFTKDQEIFMMVERDYSLRRGLAIVMINNKLQVENYS